MLFNSVPAMTSSACSFVPHALGPAIAPPGATVGGISNRVPQSILRQIYTHLPHTIHVYTSQLSYSLSCGGAALRALHCVPSEDRAEKPKDVGDCKWEFECKASEQGSTSQKAFEEGQSSWIALMHWVCRWRSTEKDSSAGGAHPRIPCGRLTCRIIVGNSI